MTRSIDMAPGSPAPLDIDLQEVTLEFPGPRGGVLTVFTDLSLTAAPGSFNILLGPSGCGKSTLLNVIDGLMAPTRAERVQVLGRDVVVGRQPERRIGYVFQSARLLPWKTLRQNAEFGLEGLGLQPRVRWPELIDKYFGLAGLSDFLDYYPHQVSGGMQQRAAIVRAWVNEPRILLMDEPFSHLDEISAGELRRGLVDLWTQDDERRTIVFVTHDIGEAALLGERIVMMTPRPSSICYVRDVDLPWPRHSHDDAVIDIERELRQAFAERASVEV